MSNQIDIVVFPDSHEAEACGFNYNEWEKRPTATTAVKAVIIKNGTQGGNPTIDFIAQDATGNKSVFMITAKLLEQIVGYSK